MAHLRRSSWTTATNGAVAIKQTQQHVTLHYPGFGTNSVKTAGWSRKRCLDQIAAWRRMHVPSAYREIAYSFFALPTGDFVDGRGLRQNGANGTTAANRAGLSIQVLIGDNEPLSAGHIKAVNDCLAYIRKHHPGAVGTLRGHQYWVSTRCPGPYVMAAIRAGKFGAGKGSAGGTPAPALEPWESSPRVQNMSRADVREVQGALSDLGYSLGSHGVDGSYGAATYAAVKKFQKDKGLDADGIAGPDTINALIGGIMAWSHRGADYVNDGNPATKDHQVAKAHEYSWKIWRRIRNNEWREWLAHGIMRFRGVDYVNPDSPSTKDHQIARAHEYSFETLKEARAIRVAVEALAKAEGDHIYDAVAKALEDHDKRQVEVNVEVTDASQDADDQDDTGGE